MSSPVPVPAPAPIWKAPGFWPSVTAAIVLVAGAAGYAVTPDQQSLIAASLGQTVGAITTLIGAAGAIWGAVKAISQHKAVSAARAQAKTLETQLRAATRETRRGRK